MTKYRVVGDKVTFEDNATDKVYYTYDAGDNLLSMNIIKSGNIIGGSSDVEIFESSTNKIGVNLVDV